MDVINDYDNDIARNLRERVRLLEAQKDISDFSTPKIQVPPGWYLFRLSDDDAKTYRRLGKFLHELLES